MKMVAITGMPKVLRNLKLSKNRIASQVERGLKKGGLFIQRESQEIVPIDTGNLKGGAFTRHKGYGFNTDVIVGYVADYAVYVHEDLNARHKSGKRAKYLESVVREKKNEIVKIVKKG